MLRNRSSKQKESNLIKNTRKRKRNGDHPCDNGITKNPPTDESKNAQKQNNNGANKHGEKNACPESNSLYEPQKKKIRGSTKTQLQEQMLNENPNREFLLNEIVLATIPGFAPWPARILSITGQTIAIQFFGTGQM